MTGAVVETHALRKRFGAKVAVAELSLRLERGEALGFLGPNGAGKTTSLKMLLGLIEPTSGSGTLLGRPLGDRAARAKVGFLPEHFRFQDWLTGREFLDFHGRLYVICPDPGWREEIASVAYEEATGRLFAGGVSHHKLYLDYAAALGLSKEEMYATKFCAGVTAFQVYFSWICGKSFLEGVASHMLGGEAPIPGADARLRQEK